MSILNFNQGTCTRCGICSVVCTAGLIVRDENNHPIEIPQTDEFCNRCGACVAACPTGSIDHRDLPLEQSPTLDTDLKISFEQCAQLVKSRRSVRVYKDMPVSREKITRIIEAARYAPTGSNMQDVKWLIIDNPETMQRLREIGSEYVIEMVKTIPIYAARLDQFRKRRDAGLDIFLYQAPVLINTWGELNMPLTSIDSTIALSYFDLLAQSVGLGCCWLGFFSAAANNNPEIKNILNLPEGSQVYGSMVTGYPKYEYPRIPVRNKANLQWM